MVEKGEIGIIGAKLSIETGKVDFYEDTLICGKSSIKEQIMY